MLIETINKAVLTDDELENYNSSVKGYMSQRTYLKFIVDAVISKGSLKLENQNNIRKFVFTGSQLLKEDNGNLDKINTLLSKFDNAKNEVLKKKESVDYITYTNFLVMKKDELQETLPDFINLLEKLSFNKSGGNPPKYKSTGKAVYIMYKKRKYKRTIYVKDKRKTKYCKINNEYILLSKLKVIE